MDVSKLSRRTAVVLGIVGVTGKVADAEAKTKAERKRRRRRNISLNCPPAPNCTLTNGTTCTCTGEGEPCICDSCCPTPPVCPTGQACFTTPNPCPTDQACGPIGGTCPDDQVCVDKDKVICEKGQTCAPTPVCEFVTGGVCHQEEETDCVCPKGTPPPTS